MYTKNGIVDRLEEDTAIISLEDGQILCWERKNLPSHITEGSSICIELKDAEDAHIERQELAQKVLHEIFNHTPRHTEL